MQRKGFLHASPALSDMIQLILQACQECYADKDLFYRVRTSVCSRLEECVNADGK